MTPETQFKLGKQNLMDIVRYINTYYSKFDKDHFFNVMSLVLFHIFGTFDIYQSRKVKSLFAFLRNTYQNKDTPKICGIKKENG